MRDALAPVLAFGLSAVLAASPAHANRMTVEVWPDASPDHVVACSVALSDGWISLVQVRGLGLPGPRPMRWHASPAEVEALSDGLQALVGGGLVATDPYLARQPAPPFLSVTWMTRLDDRPTTGLYMQRGVVIPGDLQRTLVLLGIGPSCGLSARGDE